MVVNQAWRKNCASSDWNSAESRILVTGAAGFIGFHLSKALHARQQAVLGLDNFNSYYPPSLKRDRQQQLLQQQGIHVIDGNINDQALLHEMFMYCNFTNVVHMAAQAGVRHAAKDPHSYVQTNLAGTVVLLEAMKAAPYYAPLVYASSSSIYGLTNDIPFTEDDRADKPASLYAATKRAMELVVHTYHHNSGLSATGLRFFTVYGPWGRPDMSFIRFARSIVLNKTLRIFKGPNGEEMMRDFTNIADIVQGIVASIDSTPSSVKGMAVNRVFNLGNTRPVSVTALVEMLGQLLGKQPHIKYAQVPSFGEVVVTHANITLARTELQYSPAVDLATGTAEFVEWFVDYYGSALEKQQADDRAYVPSR
jgi:UDP-glucuronate 4-epimerase